MGKGVFERPGAKTVIIEKTDVYGAWDALHSYGYADIEHLDDVQWRYQAFVATLCARLPRMVHPPQPPRWADQNTMIIAENGLDAMGFTDGEDAFDLSVIPKAGKTAFRRWRSRMWRTRPRGCLGRGGWMTPCGSGPALGPLRRIRPFKSGFFTSTPRGRQGPCGGNASPFFR